MGVTTTNNKPINPRGNDQSPKGYNRAALYSGKALDFDGVNDKVTTSLALTSDDVSISFYLNWDDVGTQTIGFVCEGSANDKMMIHTGASGAGVNGLQIAINTTNYSVPQIISEGWNHYLITSNRTNLNIYKNGVLFDSRTTDAGAVDTTALTLGVRPIGSAYALDGQIAGFKIFNTALTAAQVADLYNNPEKVVPTGLESNLKLWLPMMEGAGTTAYDGSGNGNHGTISGATYVNGIGAPVAQSAVMDWNKGTNLLKYSEQIDNAAYTKSGGSGYSVVVTANHGTSPDGTQTADRVQITRGTSYAELFQRTTTSMVVGEDYVLSFYAKSLSGTPTLYTAWNDDYLNEVTFTTDWVRYEYQYQYISHIQGSGFNLVTWTSLPTTSTTADLLIWGVQLEKASSLGAYIPNHTNTAITSEVLLPQGLTTGRDITGVNLFENVRKQGALNLDGNSWALVHDNLSNDIEDEVTLECWYYHVETTAINHLIGKRDGSNEWLRIYSASSNSIRLERNGGNSSSDVSITENAWNHIVTTIDDSDNMKVYINGTQQLSTASFAPWSMNNSAPVSIAAWATSTTAPPAVNSRTTGQLAQPRIYNRALTAEEVQRNYNAGKNTYTNS